MYYSEFTESHYSCCTDFNSNGIEWHHMYWTGCWPLSIILNISMAAEVKRPACQVIGQCFGFTNAQCTKLYSQNRLHPGGFAQLYIWLVLNKAILWLHVHDFDTPTSGIRVWKYFVEMLTFSLKHHLMLTSWIYYQFEGIQILGKLNLKLLCHSL